MLSHLIVTDARIPALAHDLAAEAHEDGADAATFELTPYHVARLRKLLGVEPGSWPPAPHTRCLEAHIRVELARAA